MTRVAVYANAKSLRRKSGPELKALRAAGLSMVYMGLESGDDTVLEAMRKGCSAATIVEQGQRARRAGIKLNVTVINGLAGVEGSLTHARLTAEALNEMAPDQVAALSLMLVPGTELHGRCERGEFVLPDGLAMLAELREMLSGLNLKRGLFLANHASNYLPLKVRLPSGKADALATLDQALDGQAELRPEWARGL